MKFYRYEARQYVSIDTDGEYYSSSIPNPKLEVREFDLVKETPKGYWIGLFLKPMDKPYYEKWVSKTAKKRYAYPTKEEALNNYIRRTESRIKILKAQLLSSQIALGRAEIINKHLKLEQQIYLNLKS